MDRAMIAALVESHEGNRLSVYLDTCGNLTIGRGFNLNAPGAAEICTNFGLDYHSLCSGAVNLTEEQSDTLFESSLSSAIYAAQCLVSTFSTLPDQTQAVVVDMIYNLGSTGFSKFVKLIAALNAKDYTVAAEEIRNSKWCGQVAGRCSEDAALMEQCE